ILLIIITIFLHAFSIVFCPGGSTGQSVKQTTGIMTVTEGQLVSLHCSYETQFRDTRYLFWYIQPPDQPPKFLLASYSKQAQQAHGFQATHIPHNNKQKGTFNMQKPAIQLKDSAVYFCTLQETQ
uniref:Ig-like domain-containing protein n=1 Tax=Laticauda laticaudata TaxID=8630 RepID=A0A8C5RNW5_LATLA